MIFHVLELELSQRYVGIYVWLWKVHPFQVNLQICWIRLKQKNCLQNGILNCTWPHLLVCEAKTFKLDLAILLIHWKPEIHIFWPSPYFVQKTHRIYANITHPLETWYTFSSRVLLYSKDLLYPCKHFSSTGNNVCMVQMLWNSLCEYIPMFTKNLKKSITCNKIGKVKTVWAKLLYLAHFIN